MYATSDGIRTVAILQDTDPENPRNPAYMDNVSHMICWHRRYNLGDKHHYEDPHAFAMDLANNYATQEDLFAFIHAGNCKNVHLTENGSFYDVEITSDYLDEPIKLDIRLDHDLNLVSDEYDDMREDLLDSMSATELLQLCQDNIAVLPLYLYDHSGITMSTGSFIGRAHHAEWDSGQVGFIYLDKETAMKELAMPADTLRLAFIQSEGRRSTEKLALKVGETLTDCLERNGFTPVKKEHIRNLDDPKFSSFDVAALEQSRVFKHGHMLYCLTDNVQADFATLESVATFNPDLQRLTEATWKDCALQVLEADVKTYDAYLTDEIYGFQAYEGLKEIDSCWGFNYAGEDIREQLYDMTGGWATPQLCEAMKHASYECSERFDIDDFFANHDFPALRAKIKGEVRSYIEKECGASQVYPYGTSSEVLLSNKDGILNDIVESLYDQHMEITAEDIHEAILSEVGPSRAVEPKISASDLEPDREYTVSELLDVFNKKPSLSEQIKAAREKNTFANAQVHTPPDLTR